jgi:hypothetical protein
MTKGLPYICPACGSSRAFQIEHDKPGLRPASESEMLLCLDCGMRGPKRVWKAWRSKLVKLYRVATPESRERQPRYLKAIQSFGWKMLRELIANDAKKGDFSVWKPDKAQACRELEHHLLKLLGAIQHQDPVRVTETAADLANVALAVERSLGAK